ncbi:MAG: acetyl-CoA acetyltransferase [Sphingopyxis sp.]|nr:acetyl-CoA acetyltransferase [Sphingopyxis sp.]
MSDPERIPVIIGGGQINDRPNDPAQGLDSLHLMAAALHAAEADIGVGPLLTELDSLAIVDQISFREFLDLSRDLADLLGIDPPVNYQSAGLHGDTPIRLLNEAANRIGAGEARLCAVVGGEALRTARARQQEAAFQDKLLGANRSIQNDGEEPNPVRQIATMARPNYNQMFGLISPVDVYPLYENAGRAAYGQTLAEAQKESAAIWSLMSKVAAANENAWIRREHSAEEILRIDDNNRRIAHPYSKLMVANSVVNQGAAIILASLAEARRRGVAEENIIYVGMGAAAREAGNIVKRDRYDRSVSMDTAILRCLVLNDMTAEDLDFVELYSCFPCVTKMARRTLGWPVDKPATVFGGLTFGGAPLANYMSHAVVSMVNRLRAEGRTGFLFANGGFATDNHCMVLSNQPIAAAKFPQNFDYRAEADAVRGAIPPIDEDYAGPATIETYTVFYKRDETPRSGVVVGRTPDGGRTLAHVDVGDQAMVAFLTDGRIEPVGTSGTITDAGDGRRVFVSAQSAR